MYDYEKILVERVVMGDTGLPVTVLRLPMVYGPNDCQHRLAPYLKRMLDGRPMIPLSKGMARWRCLRGYGGRGRGHCLGSDDTRGREPSLQRS